jgi:hypothetical protein
VKFNETVNTQYSASASAGTAKELNPSVLSLSLPTYLGPFPTS